MRGNIVSLIVQKAVRLSFFRTFLRSKSLLFSSRTQQLVLYPVQCFGIGLIAALNLNESAKPGQTNDP